MTRYVVGFLFADDEVLLIKKNHPSWQFGKLNGLGGHIEENESPLDAMIREFEEESGGARIEHWNMFLLLKGGGLRDVCILFRRLSNWNPHA